ncbi:hypothetical protein SUSAZ_00165 [Sulfolobus acidocaldarius SUSAZ]|nr:hypothetical protein SUSAZ_00165 [Sulfolobus acidocaldarius SUSAZ]
MSNDKEYSIDSFTNLIKALFKYDNWYLGGFIIVFILFIVFDIIFFTPR